MLANVSTYLDQHADRFFAELTDFLRIPTVSADPACKPEMQRGAEFVHQQFTNLKMTSEIVSTAGHPIVYAESLQSPDAPTVLVYGHYDVQPPDPLDLWTTPPLNQRCETGVFMRAARLTTRAKSSHTSNRRRLGCEQWAHCRSI